ncbi:cap-specific mRNA (nucleoside-2'-O-)-methyltransferase 1 isoform X2 [Solenopsis invicta]|uniref:cap-specific mRNA (nucleoside-2'-O-)-methyltransferase 1 isoform X2 n=1 Tax=Solenopsis invicta TaxID=13686 RepID=UPI0001FE99B6|nr:cap-specific mRNA (nucleoside-2'-O-)-methyltransferase 1 isoform X2 [Solenopsis invicta]
MDPDPNESFFIYDQESEFDKMESHPDESDFIYQRESKKRKLNSREAIGVTASPEDNYNEENEAVYNADVDSSENSVSQKVQHMMKRMGYKPGKGLGKDDQGRAEPIEAAKQHGRRGFGHTVPGLKEASCKWNPDDEKIQVIEDIEWLQNIGSGTPLVEDMSDWMKLGQKKYSIDDENLFCNPTILSQVVSSKSILDGLDNMEIRKARTRANPFETIRNGHFLNRAAVKMANIDRACDFMFTDPKNMDANELLFFADVCAGPGGFSEYVLSRKKWHAKGFGFTLKSSNDFTLDEFFAGPCETFHPFYGPKGDGDVYNPQNQEAFQALIKKHTDNKGVHFMMSDGGFSVEGQENIQEILSKQLYLCQCLVALMIVRPDGHFVTKLFDLFTPFSVGLIYLMYKCFDSISIFKPNSSRPANSERYLICKRKRLNTQGIVDYLTHVNDLLLTRDDSNDVIELVPLDVLEADRKFINYIRNSNNILGEKQIISLQKIAAFCEDTMLVERQQAIMKEECLKYWKLPIQTRVRPPLSKPTDKAQEILGEDLRLLRCEATKLKSDNVRSTIFNQLYDWYCMPCGSSPYVEIDKQATFYLGLGRRKVYRYLRGSWESVGDAKIELPPNTLVYAELVYESKWMGKYFSKTRALHILDAYMLGGEDVSKLYLSQRYKLTEKFCNALWKPSPNDYICIRAKPRFLLAPDIQKKLQVIQQQSVKIPIAFKFDKNSMECENETNKQEPIYSAFNTVIFIRSIAQPWARHISKRTGEFYVYNVGTKQTEYEIRNGMNNRPREAEANFARAFDQRVIWNWPHDNTLNMDALVQMLNPSKSSSKVTCT